ncbi:MAG: glycosyltransferase family 2 protein [Pseudomonadota bacterium]|nr:glycosyltransferase family 2 protein [Pseudomonadota bacterium]
MLKVSKGVVQILKRLYRRVRALARPVAAPKLVALTATRNEDWVLGLSLRVSLSYCDAVVVTDHGSTDRSAQIIRDAQAEFPNCPIDVRRVESGEWREADLRQEMLERGRRLGATHFVIVDADEVPTANLLPQLRSLALRAQPGCCIALPMISPYYSATMYRWDGPWGEQSAIPWAFGDSSELHWNSSSAYQLHRRSPIEAIDQGLAVSRKERGGLFHLQFINKDRLQSKAAWYKMMETVTYPGMRTAADLNQMYDWTLREDSTARIDAVPQAWWAAYRQRGWLQYLQPEARAWQFDEARKLLAEHGLERFSGLELHGIA